MPALNDLQIASSHVPMFDSPQHPGVQAELDRLCGLDQIPLKSQINNTLSLVSSFSAEAAASLNIPGFGGGSASGAVKCLVYDQGFYRQFGPVNGWNYRLGWSVRLVVAVKTMAADVKVEIPSTLAASCSAKLSSATVQYVTSGLATVDRTEDLAGSLVPFDVDSFAEYCGKIKALYRDVDNGSVFVKPVAILRTVAVPDDIVADPTIKDRTAAYRRAAYQMCAISGLMSDRTAAELFAEVTTKGVDKSGKRLPIQDPDLLKAVIEAAYASYLGEAPKISSLGKANADSLHAQIRAEVDCFTSSRQSI